MDQLDASSDAKLRASDPLRSTEGGMKFITAMRRFGDYDLLEEIARGGQGVVYRARHTTLRRDGLQVTQQEESGGLSGKPLRQRSEAVLCQVIKHVDEKIPVVSVGGIMNPEDAKRRLEFGATLIQIYTGLIYAGPGLVKKIVLKL